jgi:HlyD family secretion protein
MRQRLVETVIIILLVLVTAGLGYWIFSHYSQVWGPLVAEVGLTPPEARPANIAASGFIEVRQIDVAPEVSGRIARLLVDEGDQVTEDQMLVQIDTDLLDASITEAQAAVSMAQAQLARVEAGARSQEIDVAQAMLVQAEAKRDAAYQAWQDAILLRDNPQELDMQIAAARSQLASLAHRIEQLAALKDGAQLIDDLRGRQVKIVEQGFDYSVTIPGDGKKSGHINLPEGEKRQAWAGWNLATTDLWQAWVALNQAVARQDAARQELSDLLAVRNNPQQAEMKVAQAEANYQQAIAEAGTAQANLRKSQAGATSEQIQLARTQVDQALRALDVLRLQRQKYTLYAPMSGMVINRVVHEGENALPGKTLLTLGNLDSVDLTVYVPEPDVGQVDLQQPVNVTVDSFPNQAFAGEVVWIADQAEYTPKNVQTQAERVTTVFAVKVRIPNPEHKLKPGMPADAVLLASQPAGN